MVLPTALGCSSSDSSAMVGPDAGLEAGADARVESGLDSSAEAPTSICVAGKDCSGCDTCAAWCQCLAAATQDECIQNCQGSGAGGAGGSGGTGGASGMGAADAGSPLTVSCGAASCALDQLEFCCTPQSGSPSCKASGDACWGTNITCDGPEDCAGSACCAILNSNGSAYSEIRCKANCGGKVTERVVCTSNPNVCPGSSNCQQSALLQGYSICY